MKVLRSLLVVLVCCMALHGYAQERRVQNRPYCDLRPMHFGVIVGTHLQDLKLHNVGPITITDSEGNEQTCYTTCDQDNWDPGFQVGVLTELRLSEYFAARIAPTMYFANRHLAFKNFSTPDATGQPTREYQNLKTVYIGCSLDLIYAAKRFNNHRPYMMAGISPMMNLSGNSGEYVQLTRGDLCIEVGMGCDFYMPYFKLRPELKFMYSLTNSLNTKHKDQLKEPQQLQYANAVDKARTSIIALTFYFE